MVEFCIEKDLTADQMDWLRHEWLNLAVALPLPSEAGHQILTVFEKNFAEKNRVYHNFSHLYTLLKLCNSYHEYLQDPKMVKLAIWFHDAKYHPNFRDNEQKSVNLAYSQLKPHLPEECLTRLSQYILSTIDHVPLNEEEDLKYFLDIDVAVLGADPESYQKYSDAIRQEYKIFPLFLYRLGRKRVLNHYLDKKTVYLTPLFEAQYGQKARTNLLWEMEFL